MQTVDRGVVKQLVLWSGVVISRASLISVKRHFVKNRLEKQRRERYTSVRLVRYFSDATGGLPTRAP